MDYLSDIEKIARKGINDANSDVWRRTLMDICKYCADEEMNYRIRVAHRQDKGMLKWGFRITTKGKKNETNQIYKGTFSN